MQVIHINQDAMFSNTLLNNVVCVENLGKMPSPLLNLNHRESFFLTEQNHRKVMVYRSGCGK